VFETKCEVFFVFNGTAANSLALAAMCQSDHSILCREWAHVERDECGPSEFLSNGTKVLLLPGANAKINPTAIEKMVRQRTDIHYPKPRAVTVTQATEAGTLYSPEELKAIHPVARRCELKIFYTFIGEGGCRLMCSWDTSEADVGAFAADLAALMSR